MIGYALTLIFLSEFVVLAFIYITDRELKLLSQIGIKQYELLTLSKGKYLFVYYERKKGLITKPVFVCMITYYIVNGAGFIALFIQLIIENDSLIRESSTILIIGNLGLLFMVGIYTPKLSAEQKHVKWEYLYKLGLELKKQKEEKKKAKGKK